MRQNENVQNAVYPKFIKESRRPIDSPKSIVENGEVQFGTFKDPIASLNILDATNPVRKHLPKWFNSIRIKEWEAFEISFDEGFVVGAIYDIGVLTFNVIIFYNKLTEQVEFNQYIKPGPGKIVEDSLIDTVTSYEYKGFGITFDNQFQDGKCSVSASCPAKKKKLKVSVDCELASISQPCVAVMPLGDNRPLYSQKELFSAKGSITIGKKIYTMNENSIAIIDDHKGFYPYHMHYDWITGMGKTEEDGIIGFNLTDNQVTNVEEYNENFLWLNGDMHPLPAVKMARLANGNWLATDEHDTVHVEFVIKNNFQLKVGVSFFGANYIAPFGHHIGWIKDIYGVKHSVDNIFGMGEDKTYIM